MMLLKKMPMIFGLVIWCLSICVSGHDKRSDEVNASNAVAHSTVIGAGEHRYRVDHHWLQKNVADTLGETHGDIVFDKLGRVYVSFSGGQFEGIAVFSKDGTFIRKLNGSYPNVHGMQLREENGKEFIYAVSNSAGVMWKLDLDGQQSLVINKDKIISDSGVYQPNDKGVVRVSLTGVTVAKNGDIYLADGYASNYIHQFDKEGMYIRSFGGWGTDLGKFKQAHDINIDVRYEKPYLIICNRKNNRIEHYDFDGKLVRVISEGLRFPGKVDFLGDYVAVAELRGRVTILDKNNEIVTHLGANDSESMGQYHVGPDQWEDGLFYAPHTARFDSEGNLYVMDWNEFGRVTKLHRHEIESK